MIQGGSNLYSKRPELYCTGWPKTYERAKGIEVFDTFGTKYLDFSTMSVGSCVLGYSDEDVDQAVLRAIAKGSAASLNCREEQELADVLLLLHQWAGACKFPRSGGEAIAAAVRIAQAHTGRRGILRKTGSYHGWHVSSPLNQEQYIPSPAANELPAAFIVEPARLQETSTEKLQMIKTSAEQMGAVLIFDEISCGFRQNLGGLHLKYGVEPDIAVFSKAMANGYPMAAVIGKKEVMASAEKTFISSTTWSERTGPAAAIATIQKLWAVDAFAHTERIGNYVRDILSYYSTKYSILVDIEGPAQMLHFRFHDQAQRTLYTQLMLKQGFLAGQDFYASYSHNFEHIERFSEAVNQVFMRIADGAQLEGDAAAGGLSR